MAVKLAGEKKKPQPKKLKQIPFLKIDKFLKQKMNQIPEWAQEKIQQNREFKSAVFELMQSTLEKGEGKGYSLKEREIAFDALKALVSNKKFKENWLKKYWIPILKTLPPASKGNKETQRMRAFSFLELTQVFSTTPPIRVLDQKSMLIELVPPKELNEKTLDALVNTLKKVDVNDVDKVIHVFCSFIRSRNFKEDWFDKYWNPSLQKMRKPILFLLFGKKKASGEYLRAFSNLISTRDFKGEWIEKYWIPILENLNKNDSLKENIKSFSVFLRVHYSTVNEKTLSIVLDCSKKLSDESIGDSIEAFDSLLFNPNFKEKWIEKYWNPIFTELSRDPITASGFFALSNLIRDTSPDEKTIGLVLDISHNMIGESIRDSINALRSILLDKGFKKEYLSVVSDIIRGTAEHETSGALRAFRRLFKNPKFRKSWIADYWDPLFMDIIKRQGGFRSGGVFHALAWVLKKPEFKIEWLNPKSNEYIIPKLIQRNRKFFKEIFHKHKARLRDVGSAIAFNLFHPSEFPILWNKCSIRFFARYPEKTLIEVSRNISDSSYKKDQKLMLALLNQNDPNRAFHTHSDLYSDAVDNKNKLIIIEVNGEQAFFDSIVETASNQGRLFDSLIIGGHGTADSVTLGRGKGEEKQLDLTDKDILGAINQYFNNDSSIVFIACSTGKDEKAIAAEFSRAFGDKKVTIYAPKVPTNAPKIEYGKDGGILSVEYEEKGETATFTSGR
ncbi:hypothetical protein KAW38_02580 [Candidatus Micrarchaeota archaeon]|nr:hypothetical protein [Candidatus Micrarchaeota archaeon]